MEKTELKKLREEILKKTNEINILITKMTDDLVEIKDNEIKDVLEKINEI